MRKGREVRTRKPVTFAAIALSVAVTASLSACGSDGSPAAGVEINPPSDAQPQASIGTAGATSGADAAAPVPEQEPVAAEDNPPGDIPDDLAFVPYDNAAGRYSFTHPEGWAETENGSSVVFTDKLNGVQVQVGARTTAASEQQARDQDVVALEQSQPAFELRTISTATVGSAHGVKIIYRRNSAVDPVTGRQYRDEVERYELVKDGRELIVELYGPVGADNIDAYKIMIDSLRFA